MNPKSLQAFVAVAEEEHFGKAAKRLGITQSGLSQIVKSLEATIGARLIDRTTRSVSLTDIGETFLDNARELLQAHRLAEQKMANAVRGEAGTVRLGFVASAALGIVPRLAALAHEHAPGLRLSLTEVTSEEQIPQLKSGDIDVGLMREIQQFPGLVIQPLETERLLVAVPDTHRLSTRKTVAIAELRDEGFIMFPAPGCPTCTTSSTSYAIGRASPRSSPNVPCSSPRSWVWSPVTPASPSSRKRSLRSGCQT